MKQFIFAPVLLLLLLCSTCLGAYPYDSVAEIMIKRGESYIGGSGTLIAVSDDMALVLTCKHVALAPGNVAKLHWAATGEVTIGKVVKVGDTQDIALIVCQRPKDLRPVPFTLLNVQNSGPITNAGYPGVKGRLEWQQGDIRRLTESQVFYSCRPIPGMSGGATFDKYGNLVGVITHYQPQGGISSSGTEMIRFILEQKDSSKRVWDYPPYQKEEEVAAGDPDTLIRAPDDYMGFRLYIHLNYSGSEAWSTPLREYRGELRSLDAPICDRIPRLAA